MLIQKPPQTDRFLAQLATDHLLRLGGAVAFREQQVKNLQHGGQAVRELLQTRRLEVLDVLSERGAGPLQTLVDRFMTMEEPQRDLLSAEPAQNLEREDDLGLARNLRIGADEQHPELVV